MEGGAAVDGEEEEGTLQGVVAVGQAQGVEWVVAEGEQEEGEMLLDGKVVYAEGISCWYPRRWRSRSWSVVKEESGSWVERASMD